MKLKTRWDDLQVFNMVDTCEGVRTGVVLADKGITREEIQGIINLARDIRGFVTDGCYKDDVKKTALYEKLAELGEESDSEYIRVAFKEIYGASVVWLDGTEDLFW